MNRRLYSMNVDAAQLAPEGAGAPAEEIELDAPVTISAEDIAAVEAIMAGAGVDWDIAAEALFAARDGFNLEKGVPGEIDPDDQQVNRYLRRRYLAEAERTRIEDQMKAMLRGLDAQVTALDFVYKAHARAVTERKIAGGKKKSVKWAHGTTGFRTTSPGIEVVNEEETIAWAERNKIEGVVKVVKSVLKTPLMDFFKSEKKLPPGTKEREAANKFYVA